jgi:ferredoxin
MRVFVDRDACLTHAQCVLAAPDVFTLDDGGNLVYESEPDESHRERIEAAVEMCPTQAISLDDR